MIKPYSESCERNSGAILSVLRPLFHHCRHILEIGSGTGQHAVFFAERIPHIVWHTSDLPENHPGIRQWICDSHLANVLPPITLDMSSADWYQTEDLGVLRDTHINAVFSANTTHIMSQSNVRNMFQGAGDLLGSGGLMTLYGPFNYGGTFSSPSNEQFNEWLQQQNPEQGIRDFETINRWAQSAGMVLQQEYPLPANNRLLCWRKT